MENDIFYYATRVINGSITLSGFDKIYSFATENIDGYLSKLELKNKKVLTVGSSADQVFDLITYGVNDIELVDINPFAKYYYELKKAGIITLSYEEFLNFFCYMKYNGKRNKDTFNKKTLEKLLPLLSEDASMFWCSLETYYKPEEIRKKLFTLDEYSVSTLQRINKYLKLEYYYMLKKRLKEFELTAYVSSISAFDTSKKYDFINLSNIATYYHNLSTLKTDIDNIKRLLTNEGLLLLSYLYECDNNTKAGIFWEPVYKLPKVYEIFQGEDLRLICFDSISNYEENTDKKDSVLLLKK